MMKIAKLSDKKLKALRPQAQRYRVFIENQPGLFLLINPSGRVNFQYRFQLDGRRREMTLGTYPGKSYQELNTLYAAAAAKASNGIDPLAMQEIAKVADDANPTIKELTDRYMKNHVLARLKPRTTNEYRRQLEKYILPKWGKRKAKDIKRAHIVALVEKIATGTPIMANRVLSGPIKGMFTYAVQVGIMENNPATRITPPGKEHAKDRYLDLSEIAKMTKVLQDHAMRDSRDAILLILLTGQRPGEVSAMRLSQIKQDKSDQWWEISGAETKSGRTHRVYLNEQARKIIESRAEDTNLTDYVFPSAGKTPCMRIDTLRNRVARLQPKMQAAGIPWFTAHDLRRTAATGMAILGYAAVVPDILNHAPQGITRTVYDRYDRAPEIRQALIAWGNAVRQSITGKGEETIIPVDFS